VKRRGGGSKGNVNKQKKGEKTIKKPKHKKANKKKKKVTKKGNKIGGTEDQGSSTSIASFHSLLYNANSLVILQVLMQPSPLIQVIL
jgi:hypothetical protein